MSGLFLELAAPLKTRGIVVLVSDLFLDLPTLKEALQNFRLKKHDVVVFHVMHDDELQFPFEDNTHFRRMEIDRELQTDPKSLRRSYLEIVEKYLADVRKMCGALGVDHVLLNTAEPLDAALASYLTLRQRVKKRH